MHPTNRTALALAASATITQIWAAASGAVTAFPMNLAGFNAAAGSPPIAISFDSIAANTDISGQTIAGVTFTANLAPLIVVVGADTFTPRGFSGAPNPGANQLLPTSGANVLSPGGLMLGPGNDPPIEDDDLTIVFAEPVAAIGFDHLSQSADGFSFTSVQVFDESNVSLFSGSLPISNLGGAGAPGGPDFWGIVSTRANIKRVVISEGDNNNQFPDCNIGFDSFRFFARTCVATPDLDGDDDVDAADLAILLGAWGTGDCGADLNASGTVDAADLAILLGAWTG